MTQDQKDQQVWELSDQIVAMALDVIASNINPSELVRGVTKLIVDSQQARPTTIDDLTPAQRRLIEAEAYSRCHSAGEAEVEMHEREIAQLVIAIINAGDR